MQIVKLPQVYSTLLCFIKYDKYVSDQINLGFNIFSHFNKFIQPNCINVNNSCKQIKKSNIYDKVISYLWIRKYNIKAAINLFYTSPKSGESLQFTNPALSLAQLIF